MERRRITRSLGTLPDTSRDSAHRAEVLAVAALDDLVGRLISKNNNRVPHDFLDWVGTEATEFAVEVVRRYMEHEGFAERVASDRAEVTIMRVIYRAILPIVEQRFQYLTEDIEQMAALDESPTVRL